MIMNEYMVRTGPPPWLLRAAERVDRSGVSVSSAGGGDLQTADREQLCADHPAVMTPTGVEVGATEGQPAGHVELDLADGGNVGPEQRVSPRRSSSARTYLVDPFDAGEQIEAEQAGAAEGDLGLYVDSSRSPVERAEANTTKVDV
jgi:hypothetical protein